MNDLTDIERAQWAELPTTAISDAMGRQGVLSARLRARSVTRMLGRAYCVRVVVGDSSSLHLALEAVPTGSVLVVDAGGFCDRAVWGEVMTAAAQERGVAGIVVDGAIRDVAGIRRRGFPAYSAAVTATGPHKAGGGTWGGTVSCGGVTVDTGDLVVADEDGIVSVPWARHAAVAERAREILVSEGELIEQIGRGMSSAHLLGLSRDNE